MQQFSYSFAATMIHSVWQSAILLGIYYCIISLWRDPHPLFKRNLLYSFIAAQLHVSIATFALYQSGSFNSLQSAILATINAATPRKEILQQYGPWLFYIWTLVVVYKTIGNTRHWLLFKKDQSAGLIKVPADIKVFTTVKAHQFGITKKITVWYSEHIYTPVVFGFLKPVILLPVALVNQLNIQETEALIVHELTHIRYNDYILNWLLMAAETVWFFNPFIRIMANKIRLEREKNCDIQVLQFNYCTISYADALLKAARHRQRLHSFQLAAVFNRSQLLTRIRFFSSDKNLSSHRRNSLPFSIAGLMLIMAFTFAFLSKPMQSQVSGINHDVVITHVSPMQYDNATGYVSEQPNIPSLELKLTKAEEPTDDKVDNNVEIAAFKEDERSMSTSQSNEIKIIPASLQLTPVALHSAAAPAKEVIINEETSTGKTVTKAYRVQLKEGKWIYEPLWMISEMKPDSLHRIIADSLSVQ